MGGLKKYMPVTFATMMIGTLAIAGIPPFAGFFSKDEILFRAFLANKVDLGARGRHRADDRVLHVPADGDDLLRRLSRAGVGDRAAARRRRPPRHGVPHPADAHAHGQAHEDDHEVSHGPADRTTHRTAMTRRTPTMRMAATVTGRGMARTSRRRR